jgi:hypothetical protein
LETNKLQDYRSLSTNHMKKLIFVAVSMLGFGITLLGKDVARFESGPAQVSLLELYTSEGCSSCPPAESWLSELSRNPNVWRAVVPVSFHVDYWDNLGWKDAFSSREFTLRQRSYAASWGSESIYTPEFVLNGAEWQGWGQAVPAGANQQAGKLTVEVRGSEVVMRYLPERSGGPYAVEIVPLRMNVTSRVTRGENAGRTLTHQFIALSVVKVDLAQSGDGFSGRISYPTDKVDALAAWISSAESLTPIQATGGLLR